MKIIGWHRKGNVVRLALGKDSLKDWSGDDWNDSPYEHNADTFPLFNIDMTVDIAFGYDVSVLEACDDFHYNGNSPFSMDDFKERKAPILIIDPTGEERYYSECTKGDKNLIFIYMGDKFDTGIFTGIISTVFNYNKY